MAHTTHHSRTSVRLWGGQESDYQAIHQWLDETKELFCDARHRALRHHSHGVFEAERIFGLEIVNADGRRVPVRYIAEQHIKEDCGGRIPSVGDWLGAIRFSSWMNRGYPVARRDDDDSDSVDS